MRPKPLMPTRTVMRPPVAGDIRACGVRDPDAGTGGGHGHCSARRRGSSRGCPHPLQRGFPAGLPVDRKSTRLNSSHVAISYAVFCLKKKKRINCSTGLYVEKKSVKDIVMVENE